MGAPLGRCEWKKTRKAPNFCNIDEVEIGTNGLDRRYLLKQIYDEILLIKNPLIRYVLIAQYFEGCNGEDLAKELKMTRSNVNLLKHKGLKILKKRLKLEAP